MIRPDISIGSVAPPPLLENGDHLNRVEFERRYEAMPHVKKAELIEGVVFLPGRVTMTHGSAHASIVGWLGYYDAYTPGLSAADSGSVRLDLENEFQPDGLLIVRPDYGGSIKISEDDFLEGAPDLVAEVASTSASIELHTKMKVYRRMGVREYLVWRTKENAVDWFKLQQGEYVPIKVGPEGYYESTIFPGLRLDTAALLREDLASVFRELESGMASPEHAEFVARLEKAKASKTPK